MMLVLKLPQRPLSAVRMRTSAVFSSRTASSGCRAGSVRAARSCSTCFAWLANGRALRIRSCDLRSLDAAIIFIAFVICCVLFTARMRRGGQSVTASCPTLPPPCPGPP